MSVVFYCYLSILLKLSTWYCGILWMVAKSTKGWLKHNEMFTTYQLQSFTAVKVTGPASAWQLGTFKSPGAVDGGVAWYGCVWWDIPLVMAIWIGKIMIQWTWGTLVSDYEVFRILCSRSKLGILKISKKKILGEVLLMIIFLLGYSIFFLPHRSSCGHGIMSQERDRCRLWFLCPALDAKQAKACRLPIIDINLSQQYIAASQNIQPNPYPEPQGRSIPPIHTPDPYQNTGDPDRSIRLDHRGPIHTRILTHPHISMSWYM